MVYHKPIFFSIKLSVSSYLSILFNILGAQKNRLIEMVF